MTVGTANVPETASDLLKRLSTVRERVMAAKQADPSLPDADRMVALLDRACEQARAAAAHPFDLAVADQYELALVRSALQTPRTAPTANRLLGRDLVGFHKYEDLDPGWLGTVWNHLVQSVVPFPAAANATDLVYDLNDGATIALAGDWGTGNASSRAIGEQIAASRPDYTVHLGDVYYSGTETEESTRFVNLWPAGQRGSFTLNSNHEMYSGGHGYFGTALADPKFRGQRGHSFFALQNDNWLVLGLDSAYAATRFYQQGAINDPQLLWLHTLLSSPIAQRPNGAGRKSLLLLTHHQGLEDDGQPSEPLWSQVIEATRGFPLVWYWGHVHNVAAFKPVAVTDDSLNPVVNRRVFGRLVGHGGVPYIPDPASSAMLWTEDQLAGDPQLPRRGKNGFALLRLTGDTLEETLFDEGGVQRWSDQIRP